MKIAHPLKTLKSLKKRRVTVSQLNRQAKWRDIVRQQIDQSQKKGITHTGVDLSGIYVEVTSDSVHQHVKRLVHGSVFVAAAKRGKGPRVKGVHKKASAVSATRKSK